MVKRPGDFVLKMDFAVACLRQGSLQKARAVMQTVTVDHATEERATALQTVINIVADKGPLLNPFPLLQPRHQRGK